MSCSHEQSNDELVMEILSDLLKRLPVSVEKEKCVAPPSTLRCLMSSPIWESLCKSVQGRHGACTSSGRTLPQGPGGQAKWDGKCGLSHPLLSPSGKTERRGAEKERTP